MRARYEGKTSHAGKVVELLQRRLTLCPSTKNVAAHDTLLVLTLYRRVLLKCYKRYDQVKQEWMSSNESSLPGMTNNEDSPVRGCTVLIHMPVLPLLD